MTRLLGSEHIETLAREESVRGVLVRTVIKQSEFADEQESFSFWKMPCSSC